jgi:hypothetical protein
VAGLGAGDPLPVRSRASPPTPPASEAARRASVSPSPACEHPFVTADGSPLTRFHRAIQHGSVINAEAAARELGRLGLGDALALVELYAAKRDRRFERAALRWHARLGQEVASLTLEEAALALNALLTLDRLPADGTAQEALYALCRRHGLKPPRAIFA